MNLYQECQQWRTEIETITFTLENKRSFKNVSTYVQKCT